MKDIKFKIFASALASVLFVGCNDLDTEPLGAVVTSDQKEEVVKNDPEMVSASVTGITAMFSVYGNAIPTSFGHDDFGYGSIMLNLDSRGTDMVGLDINYNWFTRSMTFEDLFFNYRPTNILWRTMYNQIYTANGVVSTIDPATEDSSLKYYLAQALSIRAFDYFVLAQMYQHTYKGNESKPCVPLITNENANEAAANGCARSTVQEVYDQIMSDLNKAVSLLEATDKTRGTDKRYISKEVAYGLRARVNLTMQNWTAAAEDAQKAIDGSGTPYSREEAGAPGFTESSDHSWMWAIVIAETDRVVTSGIVNFPSHMGSLNYGYASVGAWRMINKKLYNEIPDTDVRKGWWLDANKHSDNLNATQVAQATKYGCPAYTQMKYGPYKGVMAQSTNASDIPLMRVEEMYLIKAEAEAMSGNLAAGKSTLENFVQAYRDPSFVSKATSPQQFQDEVWLQRRMELWGEGHSLFDLLRLKKPVIRKNTNYHASVQFNLEPESQIMIYRIPQCEMETNTGISDADNNPAAPQPAL